MVTPTANNNPFGAVFDFALDYVKDKNDKPPPPISWIEENFIDPITKKLVILEPYQKRIIRRALQIGNDGHSRYDLVIWSQPKKSGKTTVAAAVGSYVACNIESPNEISCVANDREQSAGRIYGNMQPTLKRLGWQTPVSQKGEKRDPASYSPSGTVVKAITTSYEKEAGANQGLSLWSELWAYKGERLQRLWEEMTPPPTRRFSMRWVETYAGFIGENLLLQRYYLMVFRDFKESGLQPNVRKVWPDLPVYEIDDHILVFWDHDHRMPWQTEKYYRGQRSNLRAPAFIRLHENRWVEASDQFITEDMWLNSVRNEAPPKKPATYALDASKNNDCTALIGCRKYSSNPDDLEAPDFIETTDVHIWEPHIGPDSKRQEIDFGDIENTIIKLHKEGLLIPPLWYDPYQCVKLAQDLRKKGIPCVEFPQGSMRIKADTALFKAYNEGWVKNFPHPQLRTHILGATGKQLSDQRVRIMKPNEDEEGNNPGNIEGMVVRKVDGAVAQSMAALKAYVKPKGGWVATTQEMIGDELDEE